jgi:hypothetical protein
MSDPAKAADTALASGLRWNFFMIFPWEAYFVLFRQQVRVALI